VASSCVSGFTAVNSLSGLGIYCLGDGRIWFYTGVAQRIDTIGPNLFNQWLCLTVTHTVADGQSINMSVIGNGINDSYTATYGTTGSPNALSVSGPNTYWDDITAGYAAVPVPEPSSIPLSLLFSVAALPRCGSASLR
jgi:hypothetical protein